jgi:chromosome segregation ATPase
VEKARQRAARFDGASEYKTESQSELAEMKARCEHLETENTELKVALKRAEEDNKELKDQDRKNQREIGEAHGELRRLLQEKAERERDGDRRRY